MARRLGVWAVVFDDVMCVRMMIWNVASLAATARLLYQLFIPWPSLEPHRVRHVAISCPAFVGPLRV